ncbi:tumor necrosis factor receptor superfamily member 21-like [Hemiscyllium ocellatum]|uniref:tumor necrosis factor receptor superfamily member 21-like n=1 Tax=Hemiscyllium ocellatum TaxID=170820 RepID=UPI002966E9FB|nr:tumor necrosis factor receptor superfamily member 21-like [Hemiscyllium ocellatum]
MYLAVLVSVFLVPVRGLPQHGKHDQAEEQNLGNQARSALTQNNWTAQDIDYSKKDYYPVRADLFCLKCPAGTYVADSCMTPFTRGKCLPCTEGEDYTEYPNGLGSCLPCHSCREDQEVVSPCSAQSNTVCQCNTGTFCSQEQSCEICRKCRTSCPEGQTVKTACTPTSDIVCEEKISPARSLSAGEIVAIVSIIPVVIGCVLLAWYSKKLECCKVTGNSQANGCRNQWPALAVLSMLQSKFGNGVHQEAEQRADCDRTLNEVVTDSNHDSATTGHENEHGSRTRDPSSRSTGTSSVDMRSTATTGEKVADDLSQDQDERMSLLPGSSTRFVQSSPGTTSGSMSDSLLGKPQLKPQMGIFSPPHARAEASCPGNASLSHPFSTQPEEQSPVQCKESPHPFQLAEELSQSKDLSQYFPYFLDYVPIRRFKEFMRKLQLTENEIDEAERNNANNIREGHYQMLRIWSQKQGKKASITFLLQTLCDMELVKAANDIYQCIVSHGTKVH